MPHNFLYPLQPALAHSFGPASSRAYNITFEYLYLAQMQSTTHLNGLDADSAGIRDATYREHSRIFGEGRRVFYLFGNE